MDADLALVAITHRDCARLFVAAGGEGFGGLLLFDGEASLAEGLDDEVGELDGGLGSGGEELSWFVSDVVPRK